jgi:hypothetical protein
MLDNLRKKQKIVNEMQKERTKTALNKCDPNLTEKDLAVRCIINSSCEPPLHGTDYTVLVLSETELAVSLRGAGRVK